VLYNISGDYMNKMINKIKDNLKKKENLPFYLVSLIGLLMILLSFIPYFKTSFNSNLSYLMGFHSLAYLADQADMLYYEGVMFMFWLFIAIAYLIIGIVFLFYTSEALIKRVSILVLVLSLLQAVASSLILYFTLSTSTNVQPYCGIYISLVVTSLLFLSIVFCFIKIKLKK